MVLNKLQKGFTLIEVMVVLAIMALISSVLMFNYSDFRVLIQTRNLAEEISLTIRKAQSYATSSHLFYDTDGNAINDFGLVFSRGASGNYTPGSKSFMLFAAFPDPNSNPNSSENTYGRRFISSSGTCDGTQITINRECLEYYVIDANSYIYDILQEDSIGTLTSVQGNANIVFHRPVHDADMCIISTGDTTCSGDASATQIVVSSYNKKFGYVISVWNTGQISVQNCKDVQGNTCPQ